MAVRDRKLVIVLGGLALAGCGDGMGPEEEQNDDPCTTSQPIAIGQSLSGTLSIGDCVAADGKYIDRWSLSLTEPTIVRLDLASGQFDTFLELHTEAGLQVATDDDSGPSLDSRIVESLPAGSYVVVVTTFFEGVTGSYQLSAAVGGDCSPVGSLALDQTVSGTIAADDCLWEFGGLQDSWSFELASRQKVRFDLVSTDFFEIVLIRDAAGDIFAGAADDGILGLARADVVLSPGEYLVSAATETEAARGSYELSASIAPACNPGTDFVLGDTVQATISTTDCLLDGFSPADSFGVVLAEETPLRIHVKSGDFGPVVFLRNSAGFDVAAAFDDSQVGSVRIQDTFAAGTYALFVTPWDPQDVGDYQISVDPIVCGEPMAIAYGATEAGELDQSDCLRNNGAYQEVWTFELANDTTVRIDLSSDDFDAYLVLEDSAGVQIAVNDDGGPNLNARIEQLLTAGRYVVRASAFSQDDTGAYTLTVAAPPAPAAQSVSSDADEGRSAKTSSPEGPGKLDWISARTNPLLRWLGADDTKPGGTLPRN